MTKEAPLAAFAQKGSIDAEGSSAEAAVRRASLPSPMAESMVPTMSRTLLNFRRISSMSAVAASAVLPVHDSEIRTVDSARSSEYSALSSADVFGMIESESTRMRFSSAS
ncbi:hypothetical protein J2D78_01940 [Microbacterium maritypicum]|nr:hypothetical protein [Microbacterium liquefaciens]